MLLYLLRMLSIFLLIYQRSKLSASKSGQGKPQSQGRDVKHGGGGQSSRVAAAYSEADTTDDHTDSDKSYNFRFDLDDKERQESSDETGNIRGKVPQHHLMLQTSLINSVLLIGFCLFWNLSSLFMY